MAKRDLPRVPARPGDALVHEALADQAAFLAFAKAATTLRKRGLVVRWHADSGSDVTVCRGDDEIGSTVLVREQMG